ncbi:hypothetical protein LAZ67_12003649 [Cordylochernes scorpioides]|uniref:Mos1 transposase HTH domain-containing protein n=1 Tax=Cordylochernes scorpioides TaxID=51811 RepID=A0ABY6L579_9ARAC|nr:hypothetical protein LAZ67_12003649 [Cordylochernes scorpioides]
MLEEVHGDHALSKSQCYRWFKKFQSGDFELDNEPRGKPHQKFEDAELQALLDNDSTQTQEKLAKQLQVPHELSERQQERRLVTCEGLLARPEKKSFLHRIVASDEKSIHFSNPMRQTSWGLLGQFPKRKPRPNRFGKKTMLCVCMNPDDIADLQSAVEGAGEWQGLKHRGQLAGWPRVMCLLGIGQTVGVKDANLAAARGDVTTGSAAATSSNGAARVLGNWADCTEDQGPGEDDDFTVIKNKKRRRDSPGSPAAAALSSGTRGAGATRRPRSSTGWAPRAEEVRTTRAHIAEARARQASSTEDHCVFVERSPELEPYHYMRAIDRMFGSTRDVFQVTKMNGHFLVGMASRGMAERLVNEGLEVEGTLHRAFPFRKRAERITVGNLPFFVGDAAVISALSPFGRVTSTAPKLMKAGPYVYNDGRREAFIILREGMTIERLPTRLDIPIKGEAWPAYLSSGIGCSRCRGQGHRRANCPLLAGRTTEPGPATPHLSH